MTRPKTGEHVAAAYRNLHEARWPQQHVHLTPAQMDMLLEGINWKHPQHTIRQMAQYNRELSQRF